MVHLDKQASPPALIWGMNHRGENELFLSLTCALAFATHGQTLQLLLTQVAVTHAQTHIDTHYYSLHVVPARVHLDPVISHSLFHCNHISFSAMTPSPSLTPLTSFLSLSSSLHPSSLTAVLSWSDYPWVCLETTAVSLSFLPWSLHHKTQHFSPSVIFRKAVFQKVAPNTHTHTQSHTYTLRKIQYTHDILST